MAEENCKLRTLLIKTIGETRFNACLDRYYKNNPTWIRSSQGMVYVTSSLKNENQFLQRLYERVQVKLNKHKVEIQTRVKQQRNYTSAERGFAERLDPYLMMWIMGMVYKNVNKQTFEPTLKLLEQDNGDIELVMGQISCPRGKAVYLLATNDKDIVNAIMAGTD